MSHNQSSQRSLILFTNNDQGELQEQTALKRCNEDLKHHNRKLLQEYTVVTAENAQLKNTAITRRDTQNIKNENQRLLKENACLTAELLRLRATLDTVNSMHRQVTGNSQPQHSVPSISNTSKRTLMPTIKVESETNVVKRVKKSAEIIDLPD